MIDKNKSATCASSFLAPPFRTLRFGRTQHAKGMRLQPESPVGFRRREKVNAEGQFSLTSKTKAGRDCTDAPDHDLVLARHMATTRVRSAHESNGRIRPEVQHVIDKLEGVRWISRRDSSRRGSCRTDFRPRSSSISVFVEQRGHRGSTRACSTLRSESFCSPGNAGNRRVSIVRSCAGTAGRMSFVKNSSACRISSTASHSPGHR